MGLVLLNGRAAVHNEWLRASGVIPKTTALKSLGITNNLCSCLTAHTAFGSVGVFKGFDRHQEST